MKRFMSVALATAMIASMGVTAFAKNDDYLYDVKEVEALTAGWETTNADKDEIYFVLAVDGKVIVDDVTDAATQVEYSEIEDVDDLKVNLKFTDGEEYVVDYYIDAIDDNTATYDECYAVIFELSDNYTTKKLIDEKAFSINLDAEKFVVDEDAVNGALSDDDKEALGSEYDFDGEDVYINLVDFNDGKYIVADFSAKVENIELEDNNGFYFDVKASDQGKLNLTYDNVAIKSVARMAPVDADLTFYNFYGYPEFDFTGKVTLTPEEDDVEYFVYSVAKDGSISKINAKLNDDGDAYEFKTRTLGCYVLSDMELDVEEDAAVEAPVVDDAPVAEDAVVVAPETGKTNPGTGC